MKKVIITDLDGTLLDPDTYSFERARESLDLIRTNNIPLVLCSSRTGAELLLYRERLHNIHPFISENGGGLFVPRRYFSFSISGEDRGDHFLISLGKPYRVIRKEFARIRQALGTKARGFGDMTAGEVAAITGLTVEEAVLARMRDYSEPFFFEGAADRDFLTALENAGLRWTQGGRLFHAMGDHDKGATVRMLKKWYEKEHGKIITIGLGDALNDLPLLNEVDHPVLVQRRNGDYDPRITTPGLIKARGIGPDGWNKALGELLNS